MFVVEQHVKWPAGFLTNLSMTITEYQQALEIASYGVVEGQWPHG